MEVSAKKFLRNFVLFDLFFNETQQFWPANLNLSFRSSEQKLTFSYLASADKVCACVCFKQTWRKVSLIIVNTINNGPSLCILKPGCVWGQVCFVRDIRCGKTVLSHIVLLAMWRPFNSRTHKTSAKATVGKQLWLWLGINRTWETAAKRHDYKSVFSTLSPMAFFFFFFFFAQG